MVSCSRDREIILPSQREQIIFDHFTDPLFINQFIEFLSLEDRKGKDKFSPRRFCLFKVRSCSLGPDAAGRATHRFASSPSGPVSQLQRRLPPAAAAAHGAAGGRLAREQAALRGRDHLRPDQGQQALELRQGASGATLTSDAVVTSLTAVLNRLQVESLWQLLCPLLRTALSNITIETYADWGTCIATACVRILPLLPSPQLMTLESG